MAAAVRASIILAMLACALVMRSADAATAAAAVHATTPGAVTVAAEHCNPNNKTCHPGDPQAPENQEEEVTSVNVPDAASFGDEAEDADELPSFDQELIVLGH